jgi:methylmalonyl-CoA/ethylmalonyl-CoA epimerase
MAVPLNLKFHHIGIATNDLYKDIKIYESLGYSQESGIFHDPSQQVKGIFMVINNMRIELLEPDSEKSPLHTILANRQKMYHQCFECLDIETTIQLLEAQGGRIVSPPKPAVAFEGRKIAFLMLSSLLLIELVEV